MKEKHFELRTRKIRGTDWKLPALTVSQAQGNRTLDVVFFDRTPRSPAMTLIPPIAF